MKVKIVLVVGTVLWILVELGDDKRGQLRSSGISPLFLHSTSQKEKSWP